MIPATLSLEHLLGLTAEEFRLHQHHRRRQLWSNLGELPAPGLPVVCERRIEQAADCAIEHLLLELNGFEPVPALLVLPNRRPARAPGMLYCHWHGGDYPVGKRELLTGQRAFAPFAPDLVQRGIVTLAVDSWCFGERMPYSDGGKRGEEDTFKQMLWNGRSLFGMMMFDKFQALNYLCERPEVDADRIGVMGMSMGATQAWWLAALDERIRCCVDICCLTDFDALIRHQHLSGHGVYYYVPGLLRCFDTSTINELIVPRARYSPNGSRDPLTPTEGVERVRDHLLALYDRFGRRDDCLIELHDCAHELLPAMRARLLAWIDDHL